ncbi:DNA-binding transcriptional regulator, GntR family [Thermomonospora echinospora]|uniref:DNA-binding transcriptional regulator, GntR family n=1 Tax=Thermomonospora echinospora TaxID=1992 RepID=A0A1H5T9M8_9ACTN|nr:GntR family transcriptional regulator [Thermomonospora echinospora]SEF58791.1 DNA-binding transcriptional regulator, GntR family [Thermomonospora echinospora]
MRTIPRRQEPALRGASSEGGADLLPSQNLSRMSSGEQVRLYVRRLIFDGVLRQGQRVPQDAIAQTLGVSRIPVREALIALEREGWMTIVPHRGVFVNALDESSVHDHYELYGLFYGFAVRRAVERRGPELAERLAPIAKQIADTKDVERLHELTMQFHKLVVESAQSPRLRSMLRQMTGIVPGNFFDLVPGADAVERRGTAAIVRAIRKGDAAQAEEEYAKMLRKQGDLVAALFRKRGMFEQEQQPEQEPVSR